MLNFHRQCWLALLLFAAALLVGCGAQPTTGTSNVRHTLAPTGTLRIGVYPGSPTSMMVDANTGTKRGIALDLGQLLARDLRVPFEVLEYRRVAEVLEALKVGTVDFTFTNATAMRAKDVDFTRPLLQLELGYIVPADSKIANISDVDQPGMRIGVTEGSSSQDTLTKQFRNASVIAAPSLKVAEALLQQGKLDAFATNKAVLFELAAAVTGSRILDGRWGLENMAIAVPKGREGALPALQAFAERASADGTLQKLVLQSGLRGAVKPD